MKTKDMTKGDPVKVILLFAVPLLIGNIFQQVYNIVDTMAAGYNLGDSAIAAIGATSSLFSVLVDFASGMNSGFGIIIARSYGAKDHENLKKSIASSLVLNIITTVLITAGALVFLKPLLHVLNVPAEIFDDAYIYIFIIIAGMISRILYNMCAGILRAVGNSRTPLYFLIFSSMLNLAMDFALIMGVHMGVAGAALATVIAETASAVLSGIFIMRKYSDILPSRRHFTWDKELMQDMLSTGFSMAMMLCIVDLGSVLYQRAINNLGGTLIVAHTSARKIIGIFMMPISSIATANSTFVSQNRGAKEYERIRSSLGKVLIIETGWSVFSCILAFLFGASAVHYLTNTTDPEVIANAVLSIRLHFLFYPSLGILLALRTTMQAMGEKIAPVISSGFELAFKVLAGFILIPSFGYIWVCLTEPVVWTVCMIFLIIWYLVKNPVRKAMNAEGE